MNIYDKLNQLSPKKRTYTIWRFNLEWDQSKPKRTEEELCEVLGVKSLNEYLRWEKKPEFLEITQLYLQSKFSNDIEEVYLSVVEKAKEGDTQSVKLMLQLQKEIRSFNELKYKKKSNNDDMFDDLEIV
ncbi:MULTISPECIES: phBC6A51 family helix-turn-helix protein [unclassified Sporosarcina]|uniref:phBC6A51 family helix-turn-helix protein n=1 Tax=unclassified Sporosarcina TaxID=2647733 RepID=UPI00203D4865|nr:MULTISPECIES: hypothetical protein [unclassified Sporosarcina]GKV64094.1 hypothetical protein NCCP2331_02470 [Sporosarcina sp. NCCP-2331]GLB54441.1 hypothetical protein NCCP2378_02260 [Sporosarcina sp. NCCP-2378]